MNFSILYGGRMSNQLNMLYHIYNKYDDIDNIYAPHFTEHSKYFNINKLCDENYYRNNIDSFIEVGWDNFSHPDNYYDIKFEDLKLRKEYQDYVNRIIITYGNTDLVSVHIRRTDYINWEGGKYYFPRERYMKECYEKIKEWDLKNYKIIIFSDEHQIIDNTINASERTGAVPALDLFLMGQCNYFISTWSTFTLMAINFSKSLGKYKNNLIIE